MSINNYQADCVFCKIIAGELPSLKLLDDQSNVAIADLNPQSPTHILVIPKKHIPNISECHDTDLLGILFHNAAKIAKENGLVRGFRLVVNTGVEGGQTVDHLHVHVLGGRAMLSAPWLKQARLMIKIGFLASHNGTLMQAVVKACRTGVLAAEPKLVLSNNLESGALHFAQQESIPWRHLSSATHQNPLELDQAILDELRQAGIDLVLLLGYLKLLGPKTLKAYEGRIFNIHPSLLPKFGGHGMYGRRVHEAVIKAKEKVTGITIHHVNADYDRGEIVSQCIIPVEPEDTTESLQARVLQREYTFLVETLQKIICKDR